MPCSQECSQCRKLLIADEFYAFALIPSWEVRFCTLKCFEAWFDKWRPHVDSGGDV